MAGTKEGGIKASKAVIERYGRKHYVNIGRKGGMNGHTGGFTGDPDRAREYGRIGGQISKRGYKRLVDELGNVTYKRV